MIDTPRLRVHVLLCGSEDGTPALFVHGNASAATFWEVTMLALQNGYRGYRSQPMGLRRHRGQAVDATRGFGDWSDDLLTLEWPRASPPTTR
jgi:pimeloyl-ACP methyl ester carboxylesterase